MKTYFLYKEQLIPRPLGEVFAFFQNPENLAVITPPWLGFKIVSPRPIEMKAGLEIDYTIRIAGLPLKWTSRISQYDPPYRFVDEQVRGPYQVWHHTHIFKAVPEGTRVRDEVRYAIPLGWFGRAAHFFFVKKDLHTIFGFREKTIRKIFKF